MIEVSPDVQLENLQPSCKRQGVRYQSPMHLQQVRPTPPFSAIPSIPKVRSYLRHISDTPLFVPVPLVSPFVPMFPVSLISISMPL